MDDATSSENLIKRSRPRPRSVYLPKLAFVVSELQYAVTIFGGCACMCTAAGDLHVAVRAQARQRFAKCNRNLRERF